MNTNSILAFARKTIAAASLGFAAANLNALSLDLSVSDSYILENETFSVDVSLDVPDTSGLLEFAFLIDPFLTLVNVELVGYSIGAFFEDQRDYTFFPEDFEFLANGFVDFSAPAVMGTDVHLATLHFLALTPGADTLELQGNSQDFLGAFLEDDQLQLISEDLGGRIDITVNSVSVPDADPFALTALIAGLGIFTARRSFKN